MDIKHVLSRNPISIRPTWPADDGAPGGTPPPKAGWLEHDGGVAEIGHRGQGFGFDNEFPRHRVYLSPFALADRPVTCGEWLSFMEDDGYSRPEFWLSDGWAVVMTQGWQAPLYWFRDPTTGPVAAVHPLGRPSRRSRRAGVPRQLLRGRRLRPLDRHAPAHRGEWETVASTGGEGTTSSATGAPHPRPAVSTNALWVTCGSGRRAPTRPTRASGPRRGRRRVQRKIHGEPVRLRGGCCATPAGHARPPTGTSSRPGRAGPSAASGWRGTPDRP
jgi:hypothetical protein